MPDCFGKWNSVWRCFRRWCGSVLWKWAIQQISGKYNDLVVAVMLGATHIKAHQDACMHPLLRINRCLGYLSVAGNIVGLPVSFELICGNEHDSPSAVDTLKGLINGHLILPDKADNSNNLRAHIVSEGGVPVIPAKANRKDPIFYPKEIRNGGIVWKTSSAGLNDLGGFLPNATSCRKPP